MLGATMTGPPLGVANEVVLVPVTRNVMDVTAGGELVACAAFWSVAREARSAPGATHPATSRVAQSKTPIRMRVGSPWEDFKGSFPIT